MRLVTLSSLFPVSNIFQFMDIFWGISHIPLKIYVTYLFEKLQLLLADSK